MCIRDRNTHPALVPSPVINSPVSSPPQIVPKSITIPQNHREIKYKLGDLVMYKINDLQS